MPTKSATTTTRTPTEAQQFFFDHADYSWMAAQTEEQGRWWNAAVLAAAERWVSMEGHIFVWDTDGDDCADGEDTPEVREMVALVNDAGEVLNSVGGICDATAEYRRVMQAQSAVMVMTPNDIGGASR